MKLCSFLFVCVWSGCQPTVSTNGGQTPKNVPRPEPTGSGAQNEDESSKLVDWLMRYGYLPPPDPMTGQLQAWTAVTHAVRAMQKFAGLKETGVVDEETMALMISPRCSLPDQGESPGQPANQLQVGRDLRRKRAVSMWTRRNINWSLRSYPSSSHLSREMIRSLVFYALRVWAEPTSLEFHEVAGPKGADLQVDFLVGYHGDGYPFDGAGGAVGHAFFPTDPSRAGGVHLDAEEEWSFRKPASEGTDLFTVLLHEFGHTLGLSHSSARHSVMRPYYQGPAGDPLLYHLGPHDLQQITHLYGKRNQLLTTDAPGHVPEPHMRHQGRFRPSIFINRCNTSFDAVANLRGETFFFKGESMWRVSGGSLLSGRGASIRRLWGALPTNLPPLQAVLERKSDHGIIFISGSRFWLFQDLSLQEGYPRHLSDLRMDGSMAPAEVNQSDVEVDAGQTRLVWDPEHGPIWGWIGGAARAEKENDTWTQLLRDGVNGITMDKDGSIYLFKGDSYWKFMMPGSTPEQGYPRSVATDWLDCPNSSFPILGDFSLSSHPAGRQDVRGKWKEEQSGHVMEEGDGGGEERMDPEWARLGNKISDGEEERSRPQLQPCTCQNSAAALRTTPFMIASVLGRWTLLAVLR